MARTTIGAAGSRAAPAGALAAAVSALVVLLPWWRPGALLVRDLVAVPHPAWSTSLLAPAALPREVPGDVLASLAGQLLGGDVIVRLALLVALVALGAGAGRLAGAAPAAIVAGALAVWNPYVLTRLHQGQWLVVVALAAVPWVVVHLVDDDRLRLARVLALAGVSGFLTVVVVMPTLVIAGVVTRRWRALWTGIVVQVVVALPWLAVADPVVADPDGVVAFAPNADLAAGVLPSLLAGGGYFNAAVASPWRGTWAVTVVALLLVALTLWGILTWWATSPVAARGLVASGGAALLAVAVLATPLGRATVVAVGDVVPAIAVVRDAPRLLAPWVVLLAVGAGVAAVDLGARARAPAMGATVVVLLAVVALPDPVVGPRLPGPVAIPDAWQAAADQVRAAQPRAVLVVPHGRTQRYAFTSGRPVAVPFQRMVGVPVHVDSRLEVDVGDDVLVVDEREGGAVERSLAAGWPDGSDGRSLAAAGIGWVAVTDPDRMVEVAPLDTSVAVSSPTLQLVRVDAPVTPPEAPGPALLVVDVAVALVVVALLAAPLWRSRRARSVADHETDDAVSG